MSYIAKADKLTPFQQELLESIKKVNEYKLVCEANIVSIIYKNKNYLYDSELSLDDFTNNIWKVYFTIANDIICKENKNKLDDITIGLYLEKHDKLRKKYDEYGGYEKIVEAGSYVQEENYYGYLDELKKWKAVIKIAQKGFPIKNRLSDYCDMSAEEIYCEFEAYLNSIFANTDSEIKSYNACDGLYELIDEWDLGAEVGIPLTGCDILNKEIGGFNCNGNIYALGAASGIGKSTFSINYIFPSIMKFDEKAVFFINEEDEKKVKKEMLVWVANNHFKDDVQKYMIRDGNFSNEFKETLRKAAKWLLDKRESRHITIVPLERYSVNTVIKLIKKYSSLGVRYFVLDTLKESYDARTDDIFKSMMRDMVKLYDVVKPSAKNVGLFITYQLNKASLKMRYLTNNEIGQAKGILDVMSVNLMMRKPFEDEYEGGKNEIKGYKFGGKSGKSKIPFRLKKEKKYMLMFIPKNRFGRTDEFQIISEYDMSRNIFENIGICNITQDF
ncbi:MAG: helicase [Anaerostipes sp.]|uniref:helicase n=1 Tax=Anaerostipes sp. TaxID=1872530 RepID=UPI00399218C3